MNRVGFRVGLQPSRLIDKHLPRLSAVLGAAGGLVESFDKVQQFHDVRLIDLLQAPAKSFRQCNLEIHQRIYQLYLCRFRDVCPGRVGFGSARAGVSVFTRATIVSNNARNSFKSVPCLI